MTWFFNKRKDTEGAFREALATLKLALDQLAARPQEPHRDVSADLELELEQLKARVDWIHGEVRKLRGKVTGGERKSDEDGAQATKPQGPPVYLSPEWFAQQRVKMGLPGGRNGT